MVTPSSSSDSIKSTSIIGSDSTKIDQHKIKDELVGGAGIKAIKETTTTSKDDFKEKGYIIVLTGIVAAGKSSIVKAFQAVDSQFHEEDLDLRRDPKMETTDKMELDMIDETIDRSLKGEKIIISLMKADSMAKRMMERNIEGIPVKTVLAHCPFNEIPIRLNARNLAAEAPGGDLGNYRNPTVPLDQFASLYVPKGSQGIELIERSKAIEIFDSSFDQLIAHIKKYEDSPPSDEQFARDKIEFRQSFLKDIGFTEDSQMQIFVGPKETYDFIMDTTKYRDMGSRKEIISQFIRDVEQTRQIKPESTEGKKEEPTTQVIAGAKPDPKTYEGHDKYT